MDYDTVQAAIRSMLEKHGITTSTSQGTSWYHDIATAERVGHFLVSLTGNKVFLYKVGHTSPIYTININDFEFEKQLIERVEWIRTNTWRFNNPPEWHKKLYKYEMWQ